MKSNKFIDKLNEFNELKYKDPKKYWVYITCILISFITLLACIGIIISDTTGTSVCEHEYAITEEIAPTYTEKGKVVKECSLCGNEKIETLPKLTPPSYIEGVEYEEIYRAYTENELRAKEVYQFNRYRITAQVYGIEADALLNLTGGAILTMLVEIDNTYVFFYAEFEKDQEEVLKTINVGDTITFEGKCSSDDYWLDCELIK